MSETLLKELQESFHKTFEDFKKENDKALETKSATSKEAVDKVEKKLEEIELKFKEIKLNDSKSKSQDRELTDYEKAVNKYVQKGMDSLKDAEKELLLSEKAKLIAGEATLGGYLVRPEFDDEIVKKMTEFNPIYQYARVTRGNSRSLVFPKRTSLLTAYWVGEQGDVQDSASKYGQGEIVAHSIAVNVPVSTELLQDSFKNIEQEVGLDASEAFSVTSGECFLTGNNVSKPEGILTNTAIDRVTTATTGVLVSDDVLDLMFEPKSAYARNANFFGNRKILKAIRKLKDTTNQYVVQTAQNQGVTFTLFGTNFVELPGMADTVTASNEVLIYGDMFRAYRIYERNGMSILRDPYSAKTQRMVEFQFEKRIGGGVVLPEAVKILKIKA